jgi:outer membrane immunogenic protein
MKQIAFALMFAVTGVNVVLAADLPQPLPQQMPVPFFVPPSYDWSGVYVGVSGGWGWGNAKWTLPTTASGSVPDNGGVVGGTLGANFQTGPFVFGVEGDWDYSGINTGTTQSICNLTSNCQTGNNWLSTIRGRGGYAVDRVFVYLTAGGAFANIQTALNGVVTTRTQAGWTGGLGVEAAFAQNWTAKVEWLYVNLGNGTATCSTATCIANFGGPVTASVGLTENLIRVGVNYKFNF